MKRCLSVLALMLALLPEMPFCAADDTSVAAIRAQYAKMDAGSNTGDVSVFDQVCAPDCRFLQPGEPPSDLAAFKKTLQQVFPQWRGFRTKTQIDSLTVSGPTATALTTQTTDGVFAGRPLHDVGKSRDTWALTAQGWRLQSSETLSDQMTPGAVTAPPGDAQADAAVVRQIKAQAVPLATVVPGHGLADLMPLAQSLSDARVVALGEASHGTREFFQMKHRLLEFLVEKQGFTVFAMEANWPETQAVDRYIKTGRGDPRRALAGLYLWTWNTQEVLDLIEWMRAYNAAPGKHATLSFTGFDMQFPDVAVRRVTAYLARVSPASAPKATAAYAPLLAWERKRGDAMSVTAPPAVAKGCTGGADDVLAMLDAHRAAYEQATSPQAFRDARQNAQVVSQAAHEMTAPSLVEQLGARDRAMADNVDWLARTAYPGQKIVLWAHNGHVGDGQIMGQPAMGTYLRRAFGSRLYTVGFAFNRGEIRAVPIVDQKMSGADRPLPVPPAPAGSGDALLHAVGEPLFLLDFHRVTPASPLGQWLTQSHPFRMPGAAWDPDPTQAALVEDPMPLRPTYDALIYVEESHATQSLAKPLAVAPPVPSVPGWKMLGGGADFAITREATNAHGGRACVHIRSVVDEPQGFAGIGQAIRADAYQGKRIRLSGYLRTRNVAGQATLWMRVDGLAGTLQLDNMTGRGVMGTTDWTRFAIVLDVPAESVSLHYGALLSGPGEAWVDDLALETVDPAAVAVTAPPDGAQPFEGADIAAAKKRNAALPAAPVNMGFEADH